ncbi:WYL domain-containing protein [Campylobacter sp. TTU_617]|nr:WYL domain-containing protein [Campylobacter sp. TTU_617]
MSIAILILLVALLIEENKKIKPYKLLNYKGIWYLIAEEKGKLKHFSISKIKDFSSTSKNFTPKEEFLNQILNDKNIWLDGSKKAILKLNKEAKEYFFRKNIFHNFELIEKNEQAYILKVCFSYDDELLNIVKQWIPYIKIEKPLELKEKLNQILKVYLEY